MKKLFVAATYFLGILCLIHASLLPFSTGAFLLLPVLICFNYIVQNNSSKFTFHDFTFWLNITPAFNLAVFFLFGLKFLLWAQLLGSLFVFLRNAPTKLYRWGIQFGIFSIAFTLATFIFPSNFIRVQSLPLLFCHLVLLQGVLTATYCFLFILENHLLYGLPLSQLLNAEFKDLLPADLLEIFLEPMLALLIVVLWPVYPWMIPVLFIPFYGLKLVMDNVQTIPKELEKSIDALSEILEARDEYTEKHTDRVAKYAEAIARHCGLSEAQMATISRLGRLHDIGKIIVSDEVLQKPGSLTMEEFEQVKLHVKYDFVSNLIPSRFPIARLLHMIRLHHERFDGRGYPFGLRGEEIPLEIRIVSVADSWDAMTSSRVYRPGLSAEAALKILIENSGTQWDPEVVMAFLKAHAAGEIQAIFNHHKAA